LLSKIKMKTLVSVVSVASVVLPVAFGQAHAAETLVIASHGGSYQEAQRKALFNPTEKALGISIREDTHKGLAELRTQVQAKSVRWDIVDLNAIDCAQGAAEGMFEPLDYKVIDKSKILPEMAQPYWAAIDYYSTVLAWRTDKYKDNPPKSWADFWDVKKYPGARALRNSPISSLEIALLADGVPMSNLKPYDVDRAFRSLQKIKPNVAVWWTSGAQATQLITDGEVDMIAMWANRASVAMKDGAKIGYTFNQGVASADCLVVPKGAKNKALAMKAIALFLSKEQQAAFPPLANVGAVNADALKVKGAEGIIEASPSSPKNMAQQVFQDVSWWGKNAPAAKEKWDNFITN
jgi:putative spermidine/putrescine transport system substrate-binding protein